MKKRDTLGAFDTDSYAATPGTSAISDWYESIRNVKIENLSAEDLALAIRQNIHTDVLLPAAIIMLLDNPVGNNLDGELLYALRKIPLEVWRANRRESAELLNKVATVDSKLRDPKLWDIFPNDDVATLIDELNLLADDIRKGIALPE